MSAHAEACQDAYRRKRERRAADQLDSAQIDALILDACLAGADSDGIRAALQEARELASEGVPLDGRGRLKWAI